MNAPTAWPFGTDAAENDPLTKLRIPVVTSFNPQWKYIAAYIDEYIDYFLGDRERQRMLKRPLDVEGGVVTRVFIKYGTDDWGYRVVTWQYGPTYVPSGPKTRGTEHEYAKHRGPLTLEQVMDRDHDIYPKRWLDWKAAHPEVFPA